MARPSNVSLDQAPQLSGQLNADGIARLEVDSSYSAPRAPNPPRSLKAALEAVTDAGRNDSDATSTASEEDYDALKHDPMAVVNGARGGGFIEARESVKVELNTPFPKSRPGPGRLQNIPATLNKSKEHGRYILTADDHALREPLGIEHVSVFSPHSA
jgi:sterol O-acyltransferase